MRACVCGLCVSGCVSVCQSRRASLPRSKSRTRKTPLCAPAAPSSRFSTRAAARATSSRMPARAYAAAGDSARLRSFAACAKVARIVGRPRPHASSASTHAQAARKRCATATGAVCTSAVDVARALRRAPTRSMWCAFTGLRIAAVLYTLCTFGGDGGALTACSMRVARGTWATGNLGSLRRHFFVALVARCCRHHYDAAAAAQQVRGALLLLAMYKSTAACEGPAGQVKGEEVEAAGRRPCIACGSVWAAPGAAGGSGGSRG